VPALDHLFRRRERQLGETRDVDLDEFQGPPDVGLLQRRHHPEARVIHQECHRDAAPRHLGEQLAPRTRPGQIGRHDLAADAVCGLQFLRQGLQPILAAGDQHAVHAPGGQLPGELGADPGGGPGDEAPVTGVGFRHDMTSPGDAARCCAG
jgi:hypothetical protein